MKVRWTKESIRFRIAPGELELLQNGEAVSEELMFPDGSWRATIARGAHTCLAPQNGELLLVLSDDDCASLCAPEAEGVYFQHEGEPALRYLIEKDFPCAHPRAAQAQETSETFAAPAGFEERKA